MKITIKKSVLLTAMYITSTVVAASPQLTAVDKTIENIYHYIGSGANGQGVTYAYNSNGWGHPECPANAYVNFEHPSVATSGFDYALTQLAIVNSSKEPIQFVVDCANNSVNLINPTQVIVE